MGCLWCSQQLPSERDSPESLRAKMNDVAQADVPVPTTAGKFGRKEGTNESNPFGFDESDVTHYWCVFATSIHRLKQYFCHFSAHQPTFLQYFYTNKNRALQDSADRLKNSFENLGPEGGYLSTEKARDVLVRTGLEKDQLRQIWNLSDVSIVCRCDPHLMFQQKSPCADRTLLFLSFLQIDRDGLFDHDEYVVAMFLCDAVLQKGRPIPIELPASVIPPRKRELVESRKKSSL